MNIKGAVDWIQIIGGITTTLAIIGGGIWSWYQFSIGDLLKPNFTLEVTLVSISELVASKLLVFRITVKNNGKIAIRHADSKIRLFPIHRPEAEKLEQRAGGQLRLSPIQRSEKAGDPGKGTDHKLWTIEIERDDGPGYVIATPFSQVYVIPKSWGRPNHPYGRYPFVLRPGEEVSAETPVIVNDPSIVALLVVSSFHCTDKAQVRVEQSDGRLQKIKAEYGVHFQRVFDLTEATKKSSWE